jgi:hypothetical protein
MNISKATQIKRLNFFSKRLKRPKRPKRPGLETPGIEGTLRMSNFKNSEYFFCISGPQYSYQKCHQIFVA